MCGSVRVCVRACVCALCVHVHACMCACTSVNVRARVCMSMCMSMSMRSCMCVHALHECMHVHCDHVCMCMQACVCVREHVRMCACVCVCGARSDEAWASRTPPLQQAHRLPGAGPDRRILPEPAISSCGGRCRLQALRAEPAPPRRRVNSGSPGSCGGGRVLGKGSRGEHGASQPLTTPAALLTPPPPCEAGCRPRWLCD